MSVKAKFKCTSITHYEHSKQANMMAVSSSTEDNKHFTALTPSGDLKIMIDAKAPASTFFEAGKEYYLTFDEA